MAGGFKPGADCRAGVARTITVGSMAAAAAFFAWTVLRLLSITPASGIDDDFSAVGTSRATDRCRCLELGWMDVSVYIENCCAVC